MLLNNVANVVIKEYKRGENLFEQGDHASSLYLIKAGVVEVFVRDDSGGGVRVGRREAGDLLGTGALSSSRLRYTTAKALTNVEATEISTENIEELRKRMPLLEFYLNAQTRQRRENTQSKLFELETGLAQPQLLGSDIKFKEEEQYFEALARVVATAKRRYFDCAKNEKNLTKKIRNKFVILDSGHMQIKFRDLVVATLGPGDHIGEFQLLDGMDPFTFEALTPISYFEISSDNFENAESSFKDVDSHL